MTGTLRRAARRFRAAAAIVVCSVLTAGCPILGVDAERGWQYEVAFTDLDRPSGLALIDDTLYVTLEHRHHQGRIVAIRDGSRRVVVDGLQKPDGLDLYKGRLVYTQEFGTHPVFELDGKRNTPLFDSVAAEGVDVTDNGDVYVIEDREGGRLLKYSRKQGAVSILVESLEEAEGICVMDTGEIYYTEKGRGVIYRFDGADSTPFIATLSKPGFLYCDEPGDGLWITEDRTNFGRLIHADVAGHMEIVASHLKSPQSITFTSDGSVLLAEQGRNRILSFRRED